MADLKASFPPHAIAVVGMAGRFPGALDLDGFWDMVRDGREALERFTDADLEAAGVPRALWTDPMYVRQGVTLEGAESFDAPFFSISPREAQILDPQHRLFLECAWEALEDAGYAGALEPVVGVYAGASMNTYLMSQILRDPALVESAGGYQLMLGNDKDFLCTRASYKLDLRGPSMTIQTACSTSLVAVEVACRALNRGECDLALAGGMSIGFPLRAGYLYQDGMILSPDGRCRPFDAAAAGTRPGAGGGLVVLKRLSEALADRDAIHAVIRGAAVNNDGANKAGYTAPSVDGQVEAIAMAQALADVDPRTISYVEAHGTATPLGDPIEVRALTEVFRGSTDAVGFCRLGALKANIGHLDAAAGVAGLIKTVLALRHRELPPLVNLQSPSERLELEDSPFVLSAKSAPWPNDEGPRRAGVSSFGIGGTNAHVVLEEAPEFAPGLEDADTHLLVLSAKTEGALDRACENLAAALETRSALALADVAWTLQAGRQAFAHRRAVIADDMRHAVALLRHPKAGAVVKGQHEGGVRPAAFLFSGQGSQYAGMGADLYGAEPVYRQAVDACSDILRPHLGLDVRELLFENTDEGTLNETRLAQPSLFTTEYALAKLWMSFGVSPSAMIGHSVGEYVAAHLAGVLTLPDALAVVASRGRLMQELPRGAMAAIPLSADAVQAKLPQGVEVAAANAPTMCTISGPVTAIDEALRRLSADGVEGRLLQTSHAFHSAMMDPALPAFLAVFEGVALSPPSIPYVSNLTGDWITPEQATSPAYYGEHLRRAVQFEKGLRTLARDPALFFLEVGPSDALASICRANVDARRQRHVASSLSHPRRRELDRRTMLEAAGKLWVAGAALAWPAFHRTAPRRVSLPTYSFDRKRYAVDGPPPSLKAPEQSGEAPGVVRCYAPTWTRDVAPAPADGRLDGAWMIFGEPGPVRDAAADEMERAGARVIRLEPGDVFERKGADHLAVRVGVAADVAAAATEVVGAAGAVRGLVWLGLPTKQAAAMDAYKALIALAEGLSAWEREEVLTIVVGSVGGQSVLAEPVRQMDASLSFGPVLALAGESPGVRIRSVDLDVDEVRQAPEAAARRLVEEAARREAEPFVAYRAGRRWLRRYEQFEPETNVDPCRSGGVYLITGGLGGLGLQLAEWLAKNHAARLLLTSRRLLPPRDAWDARLEANDPADPIVSTIRAVKRIEALGGVVIAAAADVRDEAAMAEAVGAARSAWGGINGVIHAAGLPGGGDPAFQDDEEEIRSVIGPKVDGLKVLLQVLGEQPLDFMALMSSINAVTASPYAAPYAAANAVLDSFAESDMRPKAWSSVLSINWSAWRDVGMAAKLPVVESMRAERDAFLRTAIAPADGVRVFGQLLASGRSRAVVTSFNLDDTFAAIRRQRASAREVASKDRGAAPVVHADGFNPPATGIEAQLANIWQELIGVADIGADDNFFALGGHSLVATRVLARVNAVHGVRLALRDVFEAPTIRELAARISDAIQSSAPQSDDDREEILI